MKVLANLDLVKNQLINCVIQKVSVDPSTKLVAGWLIFNTTDSKLKYYNGEAWVTIGAASDDVSIDTSIDSSSTNTDAAGAKAVYDFVTDNLKDIRSVSGGMVLMVDETSGEVTGISIDTTVTEDSDNLITSDAVYTALQNAISTVDAMKFKGTVAADGTVTSTDTAINNKVITTLTNIKNGWTFKASAAIPTSVLGTDKPAEAGDMIICCGDMATYDATKISIIQNNIDGAVTGPASSTNETVVVFDGATGKVVKGSTVTKTQLEGLFTKLIGLQATADAADVVLTSSNTSDTTKVLPGQTVSAALKTTGVTAGTYADNSSITQAIDDGDSFTIPQFTVDNKGRLSAASNKTITLGLASKANIYRKASPALTADSNNDCTWVISDIDLTANQYPQVSLYEASTGEAVLADIVTNFANDTITIILRNTGNLIANAYYATIVV